MQASPFDDADGLERAADSVGCFHFLTGRLFRCPADATEYVVELLKLQESPWIWESQYVVFKVHIFVWNEFAKQDLHWICDLRRASVTERCVGVGEAASHSVTQRAWMEVYLSQLYRWSAQFDFP